MSLRLVAAGFALLLIISALGCGGGGDGTTQTTGVIVGKVLQADSGSPIAAAEIKIGTQTVSTNEQGYFNLVDVPADARAIVSVRATGYARGTKTVTPRAGLSMFVEIRLKAFDATQAIDVATGGSVTAPSGAQVTFPANAFATTGSVTASIAVIDADNPQQLAAFPGDFSTDQGARLESFGALAIEVTDGVGTSLNLATGITASVILPVAGTAGATIPLWSFAEATGVWHEEGTLTGCDDGTCEASITHLSWWNADQVLETTCLNVCVEDSDGDPSEGIWVEARGTDYAGISSAVTDATGCACLPVKRGANVEVVGVGSAGVTTPVTLATSAAIAQCGSATCASLPAPLVVATPLFQAILAWGEAPGDLDSHFTGPCDPTDTSCTSRFHVAYTNRGSVTMAPWAYLDTDDTSSFGPEVVTLVKAFPGTYRYAVHNYSGSPDLTASMASVLLTLPSGQALTLDVPAANPNADVVWIVGDLVCSGTAGQPTDDCAFSTIGQFGPADATSYDPPL